MINASCKSEVNESSISNISETARVQAEKAFQIFAKVELLGNPRFNLLILRAMEHNHSAGYNVIGIEGGNIIKRNCINPLKCL